MVMKMDLLQNSPKYEKIQYTAENIDFVFI